VNDFDLDAVPATCGDKLVMRISEVSGDGPLLEISGGIKTP
jgi:hypothetical protein